MFNAAQTGIIDEALVRAATGVTARKTRARS